MNQNRISLTDVEKILNCYSIQKDLIELLKGFTTKVTVALYDVSEKTIIVFKSKKFEIYEHESCILSVQGSWHLDGTRVILLSSVNKKCERIDIRLRDMVHEK